MSQGQLHSSDQFHILVDADRCVGKIFRNRGDRNFNSVIANETRSSLDPVVQRSTEKPLVTSFCTSPCCTLPTKDKEKATRRCKPSNHVQTLSVGWRRFGLLRKALYGTQGAPQIWQQEIATKTLEHLVFFRSVKTIIYVCICD